MRDVLLDAAKHRIDFDVECRQALLACPACGAASQGDLRAHGGGPTEIDLACMDMSAAYLNGAMADLPNAQVGYDRFHVVKLAGEAMDEVRIAEWASEKARVQQELGELTPHLPASPFVPATALSAGVTRRRA